MTTTTLFFRNGVEFTGKPAGGARPYVMVEAKCSRCGGQGGSDAWRHTGWTCYQCGGNGRGREVRSPLYTAERLAKLNETQAKLRAKREAKRVAEAAAAQAEADALREAFEAQHGAILAWLSVVGVDQEGEIKDGFLGDMLARAQRHSQWTENQCTAVYDAWGKAKVRDVVRAGSEHIGEVGKRMTMTAKVEFVTFYERPSFRTGRAEAVHITTMRTPEGNAIVVKTTTWVGEKGKTIKFTATVKEHSEFRGEKQTVMQRIKVLEEVA